MTTHLLSGLAARIAVVLTAFAILLPYLLRRNRLSQALDLAPPNASTYLDRLWPHFWLGYLILALSILHTAFVGPAMTRAYPLGVWVATIAFFLLVFEVVLGLRLRDRSKSLRHSFRRLHFWTMAAYVALLAAHLWLNAR